MTQTCFQDAASGLLTDEAFSFIAKHLLKHAGRTQEFLTLVVFVATRASREAIVATDEWVTRELARLIRHAVRETDLLGRTTNGTLSLMLAGVDAERAHADHRTTASATRAIPDGAVAADKHRRGILSDPRHRSGRAPATRDLAHVAVGDRRRGSLIGR